MKTVTSRASFDLSCPAEELELTVLSTEGARKLANQSLQWIAEGAAQAGLEFDTDTLLDIDPDPLADSHTLSQPPFIYLVAGNFLRWRRGPGHRIDLHPGADARIKGRRDYRPQSLKALMPELFGKAPAPATPARQEPGR